MQVGQDRLAQGVRDENDNCIAKSGHGSGEGEGILVLDSDEITAFQVRGQSRQFCLQGLNRIEVSSGQAQSQSPPRQSGEQCTPAAGRLGGKPGEGSGAPMDGE